MKIFISNSFQKNSKDRFLWQEKYVPPSTPEEKINPQKGPENPTEEIIFDEQAFEKDTMNQEEILSEEELDKILEEVNKPTVKTHSQKLEVIHLKTQKIGFETPPEPTEQEKFLDFEKNPEDYLLYTFPKNEEWRKTFIPAETYTHQTADAEQDIYNKFPEMFAYPEIIISILKRADRSFSELVFPRESITLTYVKLFRDELLTLYGVEEIDGIKKSDDPEKFKQEFKKEVQRIFDLFSIFKKTREKIEKYQESIIKASENFNVSPNLIQAVITQESQGNPSAYYKGATGLMQVMGGPKDPQQNIMRGSGMIQKRHEEIVKQFPDAENKIELTLAAYNAGAGNVRKYKGIPPFSITKEYIKRVKYYSSLYEKLEKIRKEEQEKNTLIIPIPQN